MADTLQVKVISPERILFEGEAPMVEVPGAAGDFGVLPGHAPLISSLRAGIVTIGDKRIAIVDGIAEASAESCTVLSQAAKPLEGITAADAQSELRAAEEAANNAIRDDEKKDTEARLRMARVVAEAVAA